MGNNQHSQYSNHLGDNCCIQCRKLCVFCGPCWIPLCYLSCLPCCCFCTCLDQYSDFRLRSVRPYRIGENLLKPGNDNIRSAFEANFKRGLERGAQLVVYVNGEKTVDLFGITLPENSALRPYDGDSINIIWSSGKVLASIAMCILVDRGLLDYESRVCDYWPEFAKNKKDDILVEDVLRHESGLFGFHRKLRLDETLESIGKAIENSTPIVEGRVYHGYSRGLILNQICIRCDSKKRTIAKLLDEELFSKIGMANHVILGKTREEALKKVHPFTNKSLLWEISNSMCPSVMGCDMPWTDTSEEERKLYRNALVRIHMFEKTAVFSSNLLIDSAAEQYLAADPQNEIESPSTWTLASARLMAKCAALMSQGGIIDGVRILKQSTVEEALSSPKIDTDKLLNARMPFTKGGFAAICQYDSIDKITDSEFYGWMGIHGSMMMFQYKKTKPEGIAFGYNCSGFHKTFPMDIRGLEITRQLGLILDTFDGPTNFQIPLHSTLTELTPLRDEGENKEYPL